METWAWLVRASFPAHPILRPLFPFLAFWPGHPQALEVASPSLLWPSGTHHPACVSVTPQGQRGAFCVQPRALLSLSVLLLQPAEQLHDLEPGAEDELLPRSELPGRRREVHGSHVWDQEGEPVSMHFPHTR